MVTVDWRIVNMPIADAALGESDTMTCRTPRASRNGSPSSTILLAVLLECSGAPPILANGHCQEITSSEFVKLALPPLVPIAWSFPYDHAITPMRNAYGGVAFGSPPALPSVYAFAS